MTCKHNYVFDKEVIDEVNDPHKNVSYQKLYYCSIEGCEYIKADTYIIDPLADKKEYILIDSYEISLQEIEPND